jgi:CRP-like cAMP-binding protein
MSQINPLASRPPNRLLGALSPREYARLVPHLETVPLTLGATLFDVGQTINEVYFPTRGVLSLLTLLHGGTSIEVGLIGPEGMAGLPAFLDAGFGTARCIVQVPGEALRLPAEVLRQHLRPGRRLHVMLLRYTHGFLTQMMQSIACNSLHPVEKRLCRWLLMVHGRALLDQFPLTHEFIAAMLGVRRASVTEVAQELRRAGLIRYSRGQVTVVDRPGLEANACECYHAADAEMNRVLQ